MTNTPTTLFHATCGDLSPEETIVANVSTLYYPEILRLLESARPEGCPSRLQCVFAADSAVAAYRFLMSQPGVNESEIKIYRVQMDSFYKAPFHVIHELSNLDC
jgi:hypothetical protein